MSLDVYLTLEVTQAYVPAPQIFIREEGQVKELTRAEWNERFPGREPLIVESQESGEVYWANITHNLGKMANEAGLYKYLWRPDENGITKAGQLIEPLRQGLALLESDPVKFRAFQPSNNWGTYEGLLNFVIGYLRACESYPEAEIRVSR